MDTSQVLHLQILTFSHCMLISVVISISPSIRIQVCCANIAHLYGRVWEGLRNFVVTKLRSSVSYMAIEAIRIHSSVCSNATLTRIDQLVRPWRRPVSLRVAYPCISRDNGIIIWIPFGHLADVILNTGTTFATIVRVKPLVYASTHSMLK